MMKNVLGSAKPSTDQVGYLFLHRWVGMVKGGYLDKNCAASGRIPRTSAFDTFNIFGIRHYRVVDGHHIFRNRCVEKLLDNY
jgi:hypothetical protein